VKEEAIKKMGSITIGMAHFTTNRLLRNLLKAEFTLIYSSFYNSFTMKGNAATYVWICEVKTIFAMKLFKKSFIIFFLLVTCCASLTWAQPLSLDCLAQKKHNNEFAHSGQPNGNFYCNPLMLEDVAFDYNAFTLKSKGTLKLIKGEPKSGKTMEIPFYLHLRRNGIPVTHTGGEGVIFSKAEISTILKVAQDGDELIVEPVNKEDWPAKRIVKIGGDGC
jgi:hypothetical protein